MLRGCHRRDTLVRLCGRLNNGPLRMTIGFPGGSDGKESTCNVGNLGSIPGWERSPGGGHGKPLQYSCLENRHEQRNLVGYSPWGCKELDMTERLSTAEPKDDNDLILRTYDCVTFHGNRDSDE